MTASSTIFIACDFVMDAALDAAAATLRQRGHTVVRGPAAVPGQKTVFAPERFAEYFSRADVIVVSTRSVIDDSVLAAAPRLRGIVFPSIGTESLDMAAATRHGLIVANGATPENFESMAEATVMLMLDLMYDVRSTERVLRSNAPRPAQMRARMLKGKTVGLIGLGRIARGVAQRLEGWGVDLLAYSPRTPADQVPAGVRRVSLDELLAASDLVSIHTPLTADTTHLIGETELRQMKPGAFLINTARGKCVDEAAVALALAQGTIAGVALDAFAVEPLPADSPLRAFDNALLTPHMVGHTAELFSSFAPACVANVEHVLRGVMPPYACNPGVAEAWRARLELLQAS